MSGQEDPHGDEREEGMSACGCDAPIAKAPSDDDDAVEHLWQVRDIQLGLVSGVLLLAGFLAGLAGWEAAELVLSWAALLVGGVGIGNAVDSFLIGRRRTIASLKSQGAPAGACAAGLLRR